MKKGILILSSAALIGFTTSCGGGGDKAKELQAEVDSLEQRMQFVTDSITNSWQSKLDSAVQATKQQMRAAMSSKSGGSSSGGSSSKTQETASSQKDRGAATKKGDAESQKKRGAATKKGDVESQKKRGAATKVEGDN